MKTLGPRHCLRSLSPLTMTTGHCAEKRSAREAMQSSALAAFGNEEPQPPAHAPCAGWDLSAGRDPPAWLRGWPCTAGKISCRKFLPRPSCTKTKCSGASSLRMRSSTRLTTTSALVGKPSERCMLRLAKKPRKMKAEPSIRNRGGRGKAKAIFQRHGFRLGVGGAWKGAASCRLQPVPPRRMIKGWKQVRKSASSTGGDMLTVSIGGSWKMGSPLPSQAQEALSAVRTGGARGMLLLRCEALAAWDSSLLVFLMQLVRAAQERGMEIRRELPHGLERLVQLAFGRPPPSRARPRTVRRQGDRGPRLGVGRARPARQAGGVCRFRGGRRPGPAALPDGALPDAASGSADGHVRVRRAVPAHHFPDQPAFRFLSWLLWVRCSSPEFGAQIYVAGLVGIGMLRVMGRGHGGGWSCPAGVGASFAALIGTMQVNEEVDALSTLGISPIDFLVLPRMLALTLMVPLLTVYADLMGILGGLPGGRRHAGSQRAGIPQRHRADGVLLARHHRP